MENSIERKYQSEDTKEIFAALAKAQSEMLHASKSADNPFFKSKFADFPGVIDASRPFLSKNGLSVNHFTDISSDGTILIICQLNHSSGQWMRGWYPIKPVKPDPQSIGSAFTYAKRYTYSAIVGVSVIDDDDDGNEASKKPANNVEKPKPFLTPDNKSEWERAVNSFKKNGNLKTVLEQRQVSKEHQEQIINEAKAEDVPQ